MARYCALMCLLSLSLAVYSVADDFPPGPMQEKVKAACTNCHAAAQVTKQHKTKAEWSKVLDKMVGYGAEVSDADRAAVLKYLAANFGPAKGGTAKSPKSDGATK